ncbi:MAG: hypothetical protein ACJ76S_06965 [Solirubrobacteraceae bacterium]
MGTAPSTTLDAGAWFFRDRVIDHPVARAAAANGGLLTLHYPVGGQSVEISLSPAFADIPQNRAAARSVVDFLGSLPHASELGQLRIFIGTQAEVSVLCGGGVEVLGCYAASQHRMFVPDREPPGGIYSREYAMTHEYGHHIASLRSDAPWPALAYGAKYWSSYEHVCARTEHHLLFPGDESSHYAANPGEAFADTYAHLRFPRVPFQFSSIMRPTPGSLAVVRRDVLHPWRAPRAARLRGVLGAARPIRSFTIRQSLDGSLSFRLLGPPGSNYDLELVNRGRVVRRTDAPGSRDRLTLLGCRADRPTVTYSLRVVRRSGSGAFSVDTAVPG